MFHSPSALNSRCVGGAVWQQRISMESLSHVAGSQVTETQESILMQELEKLHADKLRLKDDNSQYIKDHPEMQTLLDEFVTEILIQRPHVPTYIYISSAPFDIF
jgi:hypothetical protein